MCWEGQNNLCLLISGLNMIIVLIVSFIPALGAEEVNCNEELWKGLCLPDNYSKYELPYTEKPNFIGVSVDMDEILSIDDDTYDITFATYFNVEWNEKRLNVMPNFGSSLRQNNSTAPVMVPLNPDSIKNLWVPNIFVYNLVTFKELVVLNKLEGLWIDTNKNVLYSKAVHITFKCPMRFGRFPFDTQTCKFSTGSYSYDSSKMVFVTNTYGYSSKQTNSLGLDYDIRINPLKPQDATLDYGPLGNFTLAGFEMVLTRQATKYILAYYLPSGFLVFSSWVSFLLPKNVVAGRILLLLTLILIMVNIFNSVIINTPNSASLTAIELWILTCFLFVFGAFLEFAGILLKKQIHATEQFKEKSHVNADQQFEVDCSRIDIFSQKMFPMLFLFFNIIYWFMLLAVPPTPCD